MITENQRKTLLLYFILFIGVFLNSCSSNTKEDILKEMNSRWYEKEHIKKMEITNQDSLIIKDFEVHYEKKANIEIYLVTKYNTVFNDDKYVLYSFFPKKARDIYVVLCVKDNQIIGYFNHYTESSSNDYDIHVWR
jgi:hypothetical protein|tara:strand:+ start:295220 stop:295627 length:408 start_codon:yes stop_codon:yes gene_type:complete